ncbi:hypothetical protein [Kitasatospora sp. LaBMicrA B282]|uniref:hypothetical protein n=1 Tax=Kitasatospora sp. LaBMicrA B282 TaxID=3420949 RepID=UPI003D102A68
MTAPAAEAELARWLAELAATGGGADPAAEPDLVWARLARQQGRTEWARCLLVRLLDEAGPRDAVLLGELAREAAELGDLPQAARAQHLHASLLDDPRERGAALTELAALRRGAGSGGGTEA